MTAKRWWAGAMLAALAFSTGCCAFCDRWCAPRAAPTCACYVPCVPTTTAAAAPAPAAGWNAPAAAVPCVCAPVAVPAPPR